MSELGRFSALGRAAAMLDVSSAFVACELQSLSRDDRPERIKRYLDSWRV